MTTMRFWTSRAIFSSRSKRKAQRPRKNPAVSAWLRLEGLESREVPSATVVTDQPDYLPGATAAITGSGYGPNETINLNIVLANGSQGTSWSVADDANGNFSTSVAIPSDGSWGTSSANPLTLTATGQTSALTAQTTFTDSATIAFAQLQNGNPAKGQVANWSGGDINSVNSSYTEGHSLPTRFEMTSLPSGKTITLDLQYDYTKIQSSTSFHAFDFLTTYNRTEAAAITAAHGEFGGTNITTLSTSSHKTTLAIPDDPDHLFDNALSAADRVITIYSDVTLPSATVTLLAPVVSSNGIQKDIRISFGNPSGTGAVTQIAVFWGAHLAIGPHEWGTTSTGVSLGAAGYLGRSIPPRRSE